MSTGNPLRHNCDRDGCWNLTERPPIHEFHDCFPRGINFGDIDAAVEINGRILYVEWKRDGADIPHGQRLLHDRLVARGDTVIVVRWRVQIGNIVGFLIRHGTSNQDNDGDTESLKVRMRGWVRWAETHP